MYTVKCFHLNPTCLTFLHESAVSEVSPAEPTAHFPQSCRLHTMWSCGHCKCCRLRRDAGPAAVSGASYSVSAPRRSQVRGTATATRGALSLVGSFVHAAPITRSFAQTYPAALTRFSTGLRDCLFHRRQAV